SLMPTLMVDGVAETLAGVPGPIIVVSNLLTEGEGMKAFTAADEVAWITRTIGRPVDVVIANEGYPSEEAVARYAAEHKQPLQLGSLPPHTETVIGNFWRTEIARHERQRLCYAVWAVLSRRLLA
ncbi:MAG TPA: 2-phospho-L-lactate transferase CofD family protein, partial [Vicinamibacterales bacterium]